MHSEKISYLLFDLGNVIMDLDIQKALNGLEKLFHENADKKIIQDTLIEYEYGNISEEIFINNLLSQSGRSIQAIDVLEAWNSMLIGIPAMRLEMLKELRNRYAVFLLSNTNETHLNWINRYLKITHAVNRLDDVYFDRAYYSHLIRDRKPNASIFKYVIADTGMDPEKTLYIDDMSESIETAKMLGFQTYLVTPGEEVQEYLESEGIILRNQK